jgi:hypothetical protein
VRSNNMPLRRPLSYRHASNFCRIAMPKVCGDPADAKDHSSIAASVAVRASGKAVLLTIVGGSKAGAVLVFTHCTMDSATGPRLLSCYCAVLVFGHNFALDAFLLVRIPACLKRLCVGAIACLSEVRCGHRCCHKLCLPLVAMNCAEPLKASVW